MIEYRRNVPLNPGEVVHVFDSSGIVRPTSELERIDRMFAESNLVISAWSDGVLVGVCRALTDFCYCCYISDLAVTAEFQRCGIGKRLIQEVKDIVGEEVSLVLVSNADAVSYYPRIGFTKADTAYIIKRKR